MNSAGTLKAFIDPPQRKLDHVNYDFENQSTVTVFKPFSGYVGFQMPIATNLNNNTVYVRVTPSFSEDLSGSDGDEVTSGSEVGGAVEFCLYGILKGRRHRGSPTLTMIPHSREYLSNDRIHTIALNLYNYPGAKQVIAVVCADASKMTEQSFLSVEMNQISLEEGLLDTMKASGHFMLVEDEENIGDTK